MLRFPHDIHYPLSIAPMIDCTDVYFRRFMRYITKHTLLYTEMLHSNAILHHRDRDQFLNFSPKIEEPLSLQIGGADPDSLAKSAEIAASYGYKRLNLNVGCPSEKVQSGLFGAILMLDPKKIASSVKLMREASGLSVSIKHRIGIVFSKEDIYDYSKLQNFIEILSASGVKNFIVHARVAIMKGYTPKENRTIPPLDYESVYRLKEDFPDTIIDLNGGLKNWNAISNVLEKVDGAMVGREAYNNPYFFAHADHKIQEYIGVKEDFDTSVPSRFSVLENLSTELELSLDMDFFLFRNFRNYGKKNRNFSIRNTRRLLRHIQGLYFSMPNAKKWKRGLSKLLSIFNDDVLKQRRRKREDISELLFESAGSL